MPAIKKPTKKPHSLGSGRRVSLSTIVQAEQDEAKRELEKARAKRKKKPSRKYRTPAKK